MIVAFALGKRGNFPSGLARELIMLWHCMLSLPLLSFLEGIPWDGGLGAWDGWYRLHGLAKVSFTFVAMLNVSPHNAFCGLLPPQRIDIVPKA